MADERICEVGLRPAYRGHSKNDLRSLLEYIVEKWFGLTLVQEWLKMQRWPCIRSVQECSSLVYLNSINQLIFVMVKCCVFFAVRTEFLSSIKTSLGFNRFRLSQVSGKCSSQIQFQIEMIPKSLTDTVPDRFHFNTHYGFRFRKI
jgi:hypothetical protein